MALHARLGPSNHRWPKCPGSIQQEEQYEDVAGEAAIDGTGSHLLLEMAIEECVRAESFIGTTIGAGDEENPQGWLVDAARAERVQMCLDYLTRRHTELSEQFPGAVIMIEAEKKVDIGGANGRTDYWGTVDVTITVLIGADCVFLEVADYKDGRGYVHAEDNTQLLSYLAGSLRPFVCSGPDLVRPFKPVSFPVRMTIVQPKQRTPIRYQDVNAGYVWAKYIELDKAASATDKPDAPLVAGKHCQWCKANPKRGGHCTAEKSESFEAIKSMSADIIATDNQSLFELIEQSMDNISAMSSENLTKLAEVKAGYLSIFAKVDSEIQRRVEFGEHISGFAMKPGKSSRVWNGTEEEIVKLLKARKLKQDDYYPKKLISVAQMEKQKGLTDKQKKDLLEKYVTTVAGKDTLTRVAHSSQSSAEEMFKDVATNVLQSDTNVVESTTPPIFQF